MAIINYQPIIVHEEVEERESSHTLHGNQVGSTTVESSMELCEKIKNETAL